MGDVLAWLEAHEKLAGWAQAVAVTIALVIAIAIPWWQRRTQMLDERRRETNMEVLNRRATYFLLTDIGGWLEGQADLSKMPRSLAHKRTEAGSLLERIATQEAREDSADRAIALFRARGALLQTQAALEFSLMCEQPLTEPEVGLLQTRIVLVRTLTRETRRGLSKAAFRYDLQKAHLLLKPIVWWMERTRRGRRVRWRLARRIERRQNLVVHGRPHG